MFNTSPCHFINCFRPPLPYANSKVAPFELRHHTIEAASKPVSNLVTIKYNLLIPEKKIQCRSETKSTDQTQTTDTDIPLIKSTRHDNNSSKTNCYCPASTAFIPLFEVGNASRTKS